MAPVLPFICEKIYQGLIDEEKTSIHYCDYPESNPNLIDKDLAELSRLDRAMRPYASKYHVRFYRNPEQLLKRMKNKFSRKSL